jgi:ribosomal protein S18 acetylase RimI-like enzyme
MAGWTPQVARCPPEDRSEALEVLYRRVPKSIRPRLIAQAMTEVQRGEIDLSGLWAGWRRGKVIGALLSQPLGGRAAAIWAPEVESSWRRASTAIALVRAALEDYRARGFRLAQALLDESAPREGPADLSGGGMPHVTDLVYLEAQTADPLAVRPGLPQINWVPFSPDTEATFQAALQTTYIGSLDMPELEGLRSLDDILASHRATGRFVPDRWQLGRVESEPDAFAVLLLSAALDHDAWEVAYLGLSPPARSRGLGRAVLAHAMHLARPHTSKLELAVDVRNLPAHHLYRAAGLRPFDRRAVHLVSFL